MIRTAGNRVMMAVSLALAALILGEAVHDNVFERASAAGAAERKVILIQGIRSESGCLDTKFMDTFGGVIAALKAQTYVPLNDDDFLGMSYKSGTDDETYCSTPGSNSEVLIPQYSPDDTCSGLDTADSNLDSLINVYPDTTTFDIVGHSMGGVVAAYFVAKRPADDAIVRRIHSVTTLDSPLQGVTTAQALLADLFIGCPSNSSIEDLNASSTKMATVRGSTSSKTLVTTVRNSADLVVPSSIAFLAGSWNDVLFTNSCSVNNHECVLDTAGPTAVRNAVVDEHCGTLAADTTWTATTTHVVTCDLIVPFGVTLTVEPGAVVKIGFAQGIRVQGTLQAVGSPGNRVTFTSLNDDTAGGDTNGAGPAPAPSDWSAIYVGPFDTGNIVLDYAEVRYGGRGCCGGAPTGMLTNMSSTGTLSVTNSLLKSSGSAAIHLGNIVTGSFTIAGNTPTGNATNGVRIESLGGSVILPAANAATLPYVIGDDLPVPIGVTLTVEPGAVVKIGFAKGIRVQGTLQAVGTPGNRVMFTSLNDDTAGGDTNGAGPAPAPSDWSAIYVGSPDTGNIVLDYAEVRYGGRGCCGGAPTGMLTNMSSTGTLSVTNSLLKSSGSAAIHLGNIVTGSFTIAGNTPTGNATNGVRIESLGGSVILPAANAATLPYVLGALTVPVGIGMDIRAGTIIKFVGCGALVADGGNIVADNVVFTSIKDDSVGGDTNGVVSSPSVGDWKHLQAINGGSFSLWRAVVKYAGGCGAGDSDADGTPGDTELLLGTDPSLIDTDGDGVSDGQLGRTSPTLILAGPDNCGAVANADQRNTDGNFINLHVFGKLFDDMTAVDSDNEGDACDADDDNDGRADSDEIAGTGCGAFTSPTDPLDEDSDNDRVLDGWECSAGTNPNDAGSKPSNCHVAGDADGDGVLDSRERCFYGTSTSNTNSDSDALDDGCEIASINADTLVNVIDLQQIALSIPPGGIAGYILDFDVNKDGGINVIDLSWVAMRSGPCP